MIQKLNNMQDRIKSLQAKHQQTVDNFTLLKKLQGQVKEEIQMTQEDYDGHQVGQADIVAQREELD